MKGEDAEVAENSRELMEGLLESFNEFISENGVFLACYIISNSETKARKTLVKELLDESAKSKHDYFYAI